MARFLKNFPKVVGVLIILSLMAAGCSSGADKSAQTGGSAQPKGQLTDPVKLMFLGYGEGSAGTIMTAKVGELILNELPKGSTVRTTTGSSLSNLSRVATKQADIAATVATFVSLAMDKKPPFEKGLPNIRIIAKQAKGGSPFYIVSRKSKGITSIEDLKTKPVKIVAREKGSTAEFFTEKILNAYGITYEDIKKRGGEVVFTSNSEAVSRMQDGHSDIWFCIGGYPFGSILELITSAKDVVFISYDRSIVEDLSKKYLFTIDEVPANTYPGQDKPYVINGSADVWVTRDDVPDEVVYDFLNAIFKNEKDFRAVHKYAEMFDWKESAKTPYLHPGAEKFYKEHNLLPAK